MARDLDKEVVGHIFAVEHTAAVGDKVAVAVVENRWDVAHILAAVAIARNVADFHRTAAGCGLAVAVELDMRRTSGRSDELE